MENIHQVQNKLPFQELNYIKLIKILLSRWYWIVGSVVLSIIIANLYLWYTPKTYATSAILKFEEKRSEISDLMNVMSTSEKGPSKIQSEIYVIQSRGLVLNAIKDLDYRISFFLGGRVRTTDIYPQKPLTIQLLKFDTLNFYHDPISFQPNDSKTFSLTYKFGGKDVTKLYTYNTPVNVENMAFSIKYPGNIRNAVYLFKFNLPDDFVGRVLGGLNTSEIVKNSNIISLQETDSNPQFAADALNAIMKEYLNYDRNQKTQSATQMIHFIQSQLDTISVEVRGSENLIEKTKQNSKIIDVTTASADAIAKSKDYETQRTLLKIQLMAITQLGEQITSEKGNVSLNFNLQGTLDPLLSQLIVSINSLILKKNDLLKSYITSSQPVQDVERQILQVKNAALDNINAQHNRIEKTIQYLNDQLVQVDQQLSVLPENERVMAGLKRDFDVNDKVYSFLSEKKLEAQISRASILPGATIVEKADPNFTPISPDRNAIRHTSLILGLSIGIGLILLIRILNPFIYDKETVESLTTVPILGVIRKFPEAIDEDNSQILAISKPRSLFAESVRSVRTNLSFLASEKFSKVICITSEVAGEGKSFVAVNLVSTLSLIDKKVILIAADLRRSRIHHTFNVPNDKGLSSYLSHQTTLDDIILHSKQQNLDFIVSGPVPPNPSELLHNQRVGAMIEELKSRYDIIMIDTAPIGLVSDAIPLIRVSDINVFVIRSGKSKLYAATVPQRIAQEFSLDNTAIILNAFTEDSLHSSLYTTKFNSENYGTRYYYYSDYSGYESSGYYVDSKEKKWWNIRRWL